MKNLLLVALLMFSVPALADEHIDIKGFHVGMRDMEMLHHMMDFQIPRHVAPWVKPKPALTIGGVEIHHIPGHGCVHQAGCSLFMTGELDWFSFKLEPGQFEPIKAAIIEKYPATKCSDSECVYQQGSEKLTLTVDKINVEVTGAVQTPAATTEVSETAKKDL